MPDLVIIDGFELKEVVIETDMPLLTDNLSYDYDTNELVFDPLGMTYEEALAI